MSVQSNLSKCFATALCFSLAISPMKAHTVKVAEDVGGTLHIEPNDNPKAGESAQVWMALTRQGGKLLPLKDCNCQMLVYTKPHAQGTLPLLKPALNPISNSQYQGIPGASIVFPKPGNYELELSGTPKQAGSFKPFKLNFPVTVAVGKITPTPVPSPKVIQSPTPTNNNSQKPQMQKRSNPAIPLIITGASLIGVGVLGTLLKKRK